MAKRAKWGVIGSGGIAYRRTIPEGILAAHNAILHAVYDVNLQANKKVAKEFDCLAMESIEEMLQKDIDAIYIATPANLHCEQVLMCARAAKNIMCEKPLGLTSGEAKKMVSACKTAGVLLGTAFMMRFQAQHQAALQMLQDGKLGKPVYARAQLSCWYPPIKGAWRQNTTLGGGGSLVDMGGHCIDLLEMFLGEVKSVNCFINNSVHDYQSEDSAIATLLFENGAIATVDSFYCIPDKSSKNVLEIYGSRGSILAKGTIGQESTGEMIAYLERSGHTYNAQQDRLKSDGVKISPNPINTYQAEIEEFSQAIIDRREPVNNAQLGLRSQNIIAACYKSAQTGRIVEVK